MLLHPLSLLFYAIRACGTGVGPSGYWSNLSACTSTFTIFHNDFPCRPRHPSHTLPQQAPTFVHSLISSTHANESCIPTEPTVALLSWKLVGMKASRNMGTTTDSLWLACIVLTLYLQSLSSVYFELPRQCGTCRITAHLPTCSPPGGRQVLENRWLLKEFLTYSVNERIELYRKRECLWAILSAGPRLKPFLKGGRRQKRDYQVELW